MQRYNIFYKKEAFCIKNSKVHSHTIYFKYTDIPQLSDLSAVEQFDLPCSFVEIVAKRDAVLPFLDFSAFRPELDINGVARLEHLAKGADMDRLCHSLIGMQGQTLR